MKPMNFKDINDLGYMVQEFGLQQVLDAIATNLEDQVQDQGVDQIQETFLLCDCLREFSAKCKGV